MGAANNKKLHKLKKTNVETDLDLAGRWIKFGSKQNTSFSASTDSRNFHPRKYSIRLDKIGFILLSDYLKFYGIPKSFSVDHGSCFISINFKEFWSGRTADLHSKIKSISKIAYRTKTYFKRQSIKSI